MGSFAENPHAEKSKPKRELDEFDQFILDQARLKSGTQKANIPKLQLNVPGFKDSSTSTNI